MNLKLVKTNDGDFLAETIVTQITKAGKPYQIVWRIASLKFDGQNYTIATSHYWQTGTPKKGGEIRQILSIEDCPPDYPALQQLMQTAQQNYFIRQNAPTAYLLNLAQFGRKITGNPTEQTEERSTYQSLLDGLEYVGRDIYYHQEITLYAYLYRYAPLNLYTFIRGINPFRTDDEYFPCEEAELIQCEFEVQMKHAVLFQTLDDLKKALTLNVYKTTAGDYYTLSTQDRIWAEE